MRYICIFLFLLISNVSNAGKYELKIGLIDCQPDGMINSWNERYDHKKFWIEQNVALETGLEDYNLSESIRDCNNSNDTNAEKVNCKLYHKNRYSSIVRCLQHTRIMCRQYGGLC